MKQDKMQQQKKSSLLKGIALEIRAKKAQRKQLEAEKAR